MDRIEIFKLVIEHLIGANVKLRDYSSSMCSSILLLEKEGDLFALGFKSIGRIRAKTKWIFEKTHVEKFSEETYRVFDNGGNFEIFCDYLYAYKLPRGAIGSWVEQRSEAAQERNSEIETRLVQQFEELTEKGYILPSYYDGCTSSLVLTFEDEEEGEYIQNKYIALKGCNYIEFSSFSYIKKANIIRKPGETIISSNTEASLFVVFQYLEILDEDQHCDYVIEAIKREEELMPMEKAEEVSIEDLELMFNK
jgi:hypothetical protein